MTESILRRPDSGERLDAGPTSSVVKIGGDATGGRLSAVVIEVAADWEGPPPHVHARVDHLWWAIDGRLLLTVDGTRSSVEPGSCAFVPAGTPHSFASGPDSAATFLQVDSPMALDGYFRDLAGSIPAAGRPDPLLIGEIMQRHDTSPTSA